MTDSVIQVENLAKRYRLGAAPATESFRELIAGAAGAVARRLRGRRATPVDSRELWALRDVNFAVRPGEVVGVVGANGAGKSTLLKVLCQITAPTAGRAVIHGRVASLLEVGTGFHPELTGRENIYLNGTVLGMTRREIDARFDDIVDFSGVARFLDTPVKHYSSGMTVRLAFAVAAHLEPEVLIIDEVLAVGDAAFQGRCLGKMRQVASGGRTVLFVSHNMAAIQQLCSRAILLEGGCMTADGSPGAIVSRYLEAVGSQSSSGGGDVAATPRPSGRGTDLRFLKWRLLDADGRPARDLAFAEPVTLEVELAAGSRIEHAVLDLSLHTAEGMSIAVLSTDHQTLPLALEAGRRYVARARVEGLRLLPGRYRLDLGARADICSLDHVSGAGMIEVTPRLYDPGVRPGYHRSLLHVAPAWDVRVADESSAPPAEPAALAALAPLGKVA